jgi:hypothetical protein
MGTPSSRELQESLDKAFDLVEQEVEAPEPYSTSEDDAAAQQQAEQDAADAESDRSDEPGGVGLPTMLGFGLMVAGLLLAISPLIGLPRWMSDQFLAMGLSPALLFLAGALMAVLCWSQALSRRASKATLLARLENGLQALEAQVEAIGAEARAARASGTEEERLFEVQRLLGKQDGVIANLTKAVRMHNKPLVDLVGTATDLGKKVEENEKHTLAIKLDLEAIEKALTESIASSEKRWEGMFERLRGSENELDARQAKSRELLLERLEPHVTNACKRLSGDMESSWTQVRETLERAIKQVETNTRDEVQAVGRRFDEITRLANKLDELAKKLEAQQSSPAAGLSAEDQRQIAGMQRTAQQILSAVERLESRPAVAAMPASMSGSMQSTMGSSMQAATAARPVPAAPATPAPAADEPGSSERTGRVLSASERLKQMRGS